LLDLTFPKVVLANTMKFCFYSEGRERLYNVYKVCLADQSGRR